MNPFLRRRQCRALFVATLLGITLVTYNSVTGFWIGTGIAIAGVLFCIGFQWKFCRRSGPKA
jgi:hypothetical protein